MGALPILDISYPPLPYERKDFAADVCCASSLIGHDALRGGDDSYAEALEDLGKLVGAGMNLGGGLWATYGMSTGLLGDLLSYIRLFALGLTGGVLSSVFNSLAMEMSPQIPVVHEIVMLFILLFGHGINFGLCMISSFVHPISV